MKSIDIVFLFLQNFKTLWPSPYVIEKVQQDDLERFHKRIDKALGLKN